MVLLAATDPADEGLVEICKADDLSAFRIMVENENQQGYRVDVDKEILCSCPRMGFNYFKVTDALMRTPLMIAVMFRSENVAVYILQNDLTTVDKPSSSDGATAIELAYETRCQERIILKLLLTAHHQRVQSDQSLIVASANHNWTDDYDLPRLLMFKYKVEVCKNQRCTDYSSCPYLHTGEVGRRDLTRLYYLPEICYPNQRQVCERGVECWRAHTKVEHDFHPYVYRAKVCLPHLGPCKRFCNFFHSNKEIRNQKIHSRGIQDEKNAAIYRLQNCGHYEHPDSGRPSASGHQQQLGFHRAPGPSSSNQPPAISEAQAQTLPSQTGTASGHQQQLGFHRAPGPSSSNQPPAISDAQAQTLPSQRFQTGTENTSTSWTPWDDCKHWPY